MAMAVFFFSFLLFPLIAENVASLHISDGVSSSSNVKKNNGTRSSLQVATTLNIYNQNSPTTDTATVTWDATVFSPVAQDTVVSGTVQTGDGSTISISVNSGGSTVFTGTSTSSTIPCSTAVFNNAFLHPNTQTNDGTSDWELSFPFSESNPCSLTSGTNRVFWVNYAKVPGTFVYSSPSTSSVPSGTNTERGLDGGSVFEYTKVSGTDMFSYITVRR